MDFSSLGTTEWLVIAGVVLLLVVVLVAVLATRRRRRATLTERYGPEYERTVRAAGGERAARHDLADREREREDLRLQDLDDGRRRDYGQRMARLQYRFAEDPAGAVYEAGRVAADALQARGYPIAKDRDRALGLLAVDHPKEAQPLRTAIDGSYGKDERRLRETFIGVRDGLREVLGVHYGLDDSPGTASASHGEHVARPVAGPAAAAAGALGAGHGADRSRPDRPTRDRPSPDRSDAERSDAERSDAGRSDADRSDTPSAAGTTSTPDEADRPGGASSADRTVRLDSDDADASSRPVGAVPPAPSSPDDGRS